ncbi:bunched [Tribolium castaneum]|uniref:Bunched n=1 Tax=Tribolium castaneum TaxID=7070 RepID=A0A139WP76_TRICA|nr:bunched [Tribolium castaneum]
MEYFIRLLAHWGLNGVSLFRSAPNNNNIDRKIEEALDAVKTHLMLAVHKEVDFLKTRVSTLEGRVNELEIENSILRVNYLLFKS